MNWPPVWLLFATYKRTDVSLQAIASIKENLIYPNLHWHICDDNSGNTDDGTDRWHVGVLAEAIGEGVTWHEMDTPPGEFNLGGCTNRGIDIAIENGCSIYLIICDDDALRETWDIRPHVDVLETRQEVGAIRCAHLSEGQGVHIISFLSKRLQRRHLWGRIVRDWSLNNLWDRQSYLYTFDTIIMHKRFFDAYGRLPENLHPGLTECDMCGQYNDSLLGEDGPQILCPLGPAPGSPWSHIGERAHYYKALVEGTL